MKAMSKFLLVLLTIVFLFISFIDVAVGIVKISLSEMQLIGTIHSIIPHRSVAVIRYKDKAYFLKTGSTFHGWVINQIQPTKIHLISKSITAWITTKDIGTITPQLIGVDRFGEDITVSNELVDYIQSSEGLMDALHGCAATPIFADDVFRGFEVDLIEQDSIYSLLGLQNHDIVTEINGIPLTGVTSAMFALNSLRNEKAFTFIVERRNKIYNFKVTRR